jgi:hypothetical protein
MMCLDGDSLNGSLQERLARHFPTSEPRGHGGCKKSNRIITPLRYKTVGKTYGRSEEANIYRGFSREAQFITRIKGWEVDTTKYKRTK